MENDMNERQASFNGYARVEVMGHQHHCGYVRTEAYGAAVLFRVDVPALPERDFILEEPAYVEHEGRTIWMPSGAKVKRPATEGHSVLVGAGSIYRIIPCTEAAAIRAIESEQRSPLKLVEAPAEKALAAAMELSPDPYNDDEDADDDEGIHF